MTARPFALFQKKYQRDPIHASEQVQSAPKVEDERAALFEKFGGWSFNKGLYRIFTEDESKKFDEIVAAAFPEFRGRHLSFAYDWLGRIFSLDKRRGAGGRLHILCFVVGIGEILEIPVDIVTFHDEDLVDYPDDAVAASFFESWLRNQPTAIARDRCVGYKKPLFLGGKDKLENLAETDLEVYWGITGQLWQKVKNLPDGTRIDKISLD